MKHFLPFLLLFVGIAKSGLAQDYFQQQVDYTIDVRLDDQRHMLLGHIKMIYTNQSPNTLDEIYLLAMPNAYQKGTELHQQVLNQTMNSPAKYFEDEENLGFMDSLQIKIDGMPHTYTHPKGQPDVLHIKLTVPIQSGQSVEIATPFRVKIPNALISRLGHLGQDYMITQWYPKPAKYDPNGWHPYSYLTKGEFYSEFGSFVVNLTLPENYFVGATGVLQNEDEWARIKTRAEQTALADAKEDKLPNLESKGLKTLTYLQDQIHDFAFFASKTFHVQILDFEVEGNPVTAIAMYQPKNAQDWAKGAEYIKNAVQFYSEQVGPYPYRYCTAVDGTIAAGGGMEYPMVTVIGNMNSPSSLDRVIAHEVGHNWFYGILASDERRYPFMDEGMNSFVEKKYMEKYYPDQKLLPIKAFGADKWKSNDQHYLTYKISGSWNTDQAMDLPAATYSDINYGSIVYAKSSIAWDHLRGYLSDEIFTQAMHDYYNTWKYRHPSPIDLKMSFEKSTGKELDWFFEDVVKTTKKVDYKIVSYKQKEGKSIVKVKNTGGIAAPFPLTFSNGETLWEEGFSGTKTIEYQDDKGITVTTNAQNSALDITLANDAQSTERGEVNKLKFSLLPSLPNREEKHVVASPYLGYNAGDGLMLGAMLHNRSPFGKTFEYYIAPAFAFGSGDLVGLAGFNLQFFPAKSKIFQRIALESEVSRFNISRPDGDLFQTNYYNRINPALVFDFKTKNRHKNIKHNLTLQFRNINSVIEPRSLPGFIPFEFDIRSYEARYAYKKVNYLWKQQLEVSLEQVSSKQNTGNQIRWVNKLGTTYYIDRKYYKKNTISLRVFAGLQSQSMRSGNEMRLSAWSGAQDYRFDELMFNRTPNGSQFMMQEGGFFVNTNIMAASWIGSGRLAIKIPYLPVKMYFEGAAMDQSLGLTGGNDNTEMKLFSSGGLLIDLIPDYFQISIPLYLNNELSNQLGEYKLPELIRFSINIRGANPYRLIRNFVR